MTAKELKWLQLADFRPGVVHNLGYAGVGSALAGYGPGAHGMASMDGTWACHALPSGALGPLPRRDWSLKFLSPGLGSLKWRVQTGISGGIYYTTAVHLPQTYAQNASPYDARKLDRVTGHPVDLFVAMEATDGAAQRRARLYRARVYEYGDMIDDSLNKRIQLASADSTLFASFLKYTPAWLEVMRSAADSDTALLNLYECMVVSWSGMTLNAFAGTSPKYMVAFPDPNHHGAGFVGANVLDLSTSYLGVPVRRIIGHSFRLLTLQTNDASWVDNIVNDSADSAADYDFRYSVVGQINVVDGAPTGMVIFTERPTGPAPGVMASLTASDLLLIEYGGGAYLIQGDINDPLVRKLPGVTPTAGAECHGVQTPVGFVYGSNFGGVHAYGGGDGSTPLSPQLPPDFWCHPDSLDILNYRGRFAFWDHFVLAPNGWCFDINTQAWFRWDDPAAFCPYEWHVNPVNGYVYGNEPIWADSGSGLISGPFQGYNPSLGAQKYSWRSQPIWLSMENFVEVRNIYVLAQGSGTIAITLDDFSGVSVTATVTLGGNKTIPQMLRALGKTKLRGNVRVRLVAAGAGTDPAPVIHEVRLGWVETTQAQPSEGGAVQSSGYGFGQYGGPPVYGT